MSEQDSLESVMVLAKRLKLHNPAPPPSLHENLHPSLEVGDLAENNGEKITVEDLLEDQANQCNGSSDRLIGFGQKLSILQDELIQLRRHDQNLARQFLKIYHEIQMLKVQRICQDHQRLLKVATEEAEESDGRPDFCDPPTLKSDKTKLQHCGVTRMNICSRRFSCS